MKKTALLIVLLISFLPLLHAQDYISTLRMGPFKLGSTIAELEAASKLKIAPKTGEFNDTALVIYNNATYRLCFTENVDEKEKKTITLWSVSSANTKLKTKSGLGIGSNKAQILLAYDKYDMRIYNDWRYQEKRNSKDKIQYVWLMDYDSTTEIDFTTVDRNVTEIEITYTEGD